MSGKVFYFVWLSLFLAVLAIFTTTYYKSREQLVNDVATTITDHLKKAGCYKEDE